MFTQHQMQQLAAEVAHILANQASREPTAMIAQNMTESPETRKKVEFGQKFAETIVAEFETESEQFEVLSRLRTALVDHWQNERHNCLNASESNQRRADRLSDFIKEACV